MAAQAGCRFPWYRQTCKEGPNLEGPPLDAHHEHAGDGQAGVGTPLLEALPRPPWRTGEKVSVCTVYQPPPLTQDRRQGFLFHSRIWGVREDHSLRGKEPNWPCKSLSPKPSVLTNTHSQVSAASQQAGYQQHPSPTAKMAKTHRYGEVEISCSAVRNIKKDRFL